MPKNINQDLFVIKYESRFRKQSINLKLMIQIVFSKLSSHLGG